MKDYRYKKSRQVSFIGLFSNFFLFILKLIVGVLSNSTALIADAFHSASDFLGTLVVIQGIKISNIPPDDNHPYGHDKAEPIFTKIISILLIGTGALIGYNAFKLIFISGDISIPSTIAIYVAIISIIVKEALYQYTYRVGKKINSNILIADAWHHRSDSLSSIAALIGIVFSILGFSFMDPLAGIVVGIMIIKTGIEIYIEAVNDLMDTAPPKDVINKFKKNILTVDGVEEISSIKVRKYGSKLIVDLKIGVNPSLTVEKGHSIAAQTKEFIMKNNPDIKDVLIHVNPYYENNKNSLN